MSIIFSIFVRIKKSFIYHIAEFLRNTLPVRDNTILFDNFSGKGFGDNSKYLAIEILRRGLPYNLYWDVNDMSEDMPKGIKKVKRDSLKYKLLLSTAKVYIGNCKVGYHNKRKGTYYIQTWHGDFPLKYIEGEALDLLNINDPGFEIRTKKDSMNTDMVVSGNFMFSKIIKNAFFYPPTTLILESGTPRNDIYINSTPQIKETIKMRIIGNNNYNVAIYAPTFRDDKSVLGYNLDTSLLLGALKKKFGGKWKVIIRLHPNVNYHEVTINYSEDVICGVDIQDQQELLLISNILITDYSSIMEDFILQKKPVFLFTVDEERYLSSNRGLRQIYWDLPFRHNKSNEELIEDIFDFNDIVYQNKLKDFTDKYLRSFDHGNASKAVVDKVCLMMEDKFYESR